MIIEKWKQSHTYVTGKDHVKLNEVCQDRTHYASDNGIHVIALADGAGSRKRSEVGAEIVTKTICDVLVKDFFKYYVLCEKRGKDEDASLDDIRTLKKQILTRLLSELEKQAKLEGTTISEFSSTMLFCALYKNKYIMGHIGDGAIGGLFEDSDGVVMRTLSEPRNGGAPNITFFLTDSDAMDHLRIYSGEFSNLRGIILMSDGPAEVMFHKSKGFNQNVIRVFENFNRNQPNDYNRILHHFLGEKISQYSGDDLSLNLLYLESLEAQAKDDYTLTLLSNITSKDHIINKSQYCIELDPTLRTKKKDFSTVDEVRRYLKWI